MAKDKKKGADAKKGAAETPMQIWITRARGVGALIGFAVSWWVCRGQGFAMSDAILRGLMGAVAMSLVAWWSALLVIQALMRSAVAQAAREARQAAVAQAAAAMQDPRGYTPRPSMPPPAEDEA